MSREETSATTQPLNTIVQCFVPSLNIPYALDAVELFFVRATGACGVCVMKMTWRGRGR